MDDILTPRLQRIYWTLGTTFLFAILLVALFLYHYLQTETIKVWDAENSGNLDDIARLMDLQLAEAASDLELLAKHPAFRTLEHRAAIDLALNGLPEAIDRPKRQLLDLTLRHNQKFSVLFVLTPEGDHYLSHPFTVQIGLTKYNLSDRPYVQQVATSGKTVISDRFVGADGVPAVAIATPLFDINRQRIGLLGGVLHLDDLSNILLQRQQQPGHAYLLVDRLGRLLASSDPSLGASNAQLLNRHPLIAALLSSQNSQAAHPPATFINYGCELHATECRGAYSRLATGWGLIVERPYTSLAGVVASSARQPVTMVALILIALGCMAVLLVRRSDLLLQGAQAQLQDAYTSLEDKVQQRTAALNERNQRIRLLLDSTAEAIYGADAQGYCIFCNRSFLQMLGYASESELLGANLHETIHHSTRDGARHARENCRIFQAFHQQTSMHADDEVFWRADGSCIEVEYWAHPILENDLLTGTVVTFVDITDRRRLEKNHRESEERFRVLFESAIHGSAVADLETGEILACNRALAGRLGYRPEDLIGRKQAFLHPPQPLTAQGLTDNFSRDSRLLAGELFEDQLLTRAGERLDVQISANQVLFNSRPAKHAFFYDVTERKKFLSEQKRTAQLAALGSLTAGVAHEINNPVQGVMGYATLLLKSPEDPARVTDLAQRILNENQRIAHIARDLLNCSRHSKDRVVADVGQVVAEAVSLMKIKLRKQGVEIETRSMVSLPKAEIEPQGIRQVVINLIDNAYDALRVKDLPDRDKVVAVRLDQLNIEHACYVRIGIHDRGTGMPKAVLARARETFFTTKPDSEGTGLGLSIVNEIVAQHGGLLDIDSEEGEYTLVTVLLPALRTEQTAFLCHGDIDAEQGP